jgi:hypothetical protein
MTKVMCTVLTFSIFSSSLLMSGCCSIFTSGPQTVSIDSQPQGADVKIGPYKGKTPYTVSLPRGKEYVIVAKYGDKTETLTLEKSIEPVYWVNILVWPGLLIDLGTGKMWKYSPTEYDVSFE